VHFVSAGACLEMGDDEANMQLLRTPSSVCFSFSQCREVACSCVWWVSCKMSAFAAQMHRLTFLLVAATQPVRVHVPGCHTLHILPLTLAVAGGRRVGWYLRAGALGAVLEFPSLRTFCSDGARGLRPLDVDTVRVPWAAGAFLSHRATTGQILNIRVGQVGAAFYV